MLKTMLKVLIRRVICPQNILIFTHQKLYVGFLMFST